MKRTTDICGNKKRGGQHSVFDRPHLRKGVDYALPCEAVGYDKRREALSSGWR